MHIGQSRRDFLATLSAAGAASVLGARASLADEGPPERTTIRLRREPGTVKLVGGGVDDPICAAPFTSPRTCSVRRASLTSVTSLSRAVLCIRRRSNAARSTLL
jgi:hypothetical protein